MGKCIEQKEKWLKKNVKIDEIGSIFVNFICRLDQPLGFPVPWFFLNGIDHLEFQDDPK